MRRPLVAGNWKMHGTSASARALAASVCEGGGSLDKVDVVVCPPFVYLEVVAAITGDAGVGLGGQNVSEQPSGAFTGEISAEMLSDVGCDYVIVGHSERRTLFAESDELVAEKFLSAQAHSLVPILCLGESLQEREAGQSQAVVMRQLEAVLRRAGVQSLHASVIAYEPVWAIGTGRTATPAQANEIHTHIRERIAEVDASVAEQLRIVYGGSVKSSNAAALFSMSEIDGGLVGGASLEAREFLAICESAT